ncbi:hypothetical protein [Spirosoma pomorum]
MNFAKGEEAGWHVLIGDNGSGKSTIVRAVAACLVDIQERAALRLVWEDWIKKGSNRSLRTCWGIKFGNDLRYAVT